MVVGLTNDKLSKYAVSWEILGQLFININYYKLTIVILRQKHGLEEVLRLIIYILLTKKVT